MVPSPAPPSLRIDARRAALLIVDVQERLAAAMPPDPRARCERSIVVLLELARRFGMPVVVSEQYPRGLGPTVPTIAEALSRPGLAVQRFEKLEFACTDCPAFGPLRAQLARDQWIVVGMEAHVCIYMTARGLLETGAQVQVPADAVVSRTAANAQIGLELVARAGGVVTSTETLVFDALGRAGSDDFKALSLMLR